VVSVLAVRPSVRWFKPGRGDEFLKDDKNPSTPSFGGLVKPEAPCYKILWHVKITCKYEKKYFARSNSSFPSPVPPACYQVTVGRITIEKWWMNREFSSVDIIQTWFFMLIYITWGIDNRPIGGRSSET
jgi:hypothetical protein